MRRLQKEVIDLLKVKPEIDVEEEIKRCVDFLKAYLVAHPFLKGYVLGISGGQDSTLVGMLAQMAINGLNRDGGDYTFAALRLPYGVQADEADCADALDFIQPTHRLVVNIKPAVDASVLAVEEALNAGVSDFNKGNVKARHRMEVQYQVGASLGLAVLGTDHAAEAVTGFYTKFGDGGADLMPIAHLNKRQGRAMLLALGCPAHLYLKTPTADLEEALPGLADEVALGVTYQAIDDYLEGRVIDEAAADVIEMWYEKSRHKRHLPITQEDVWWMNKNRDNGSH